MAMLGRGLARECRDAYTLGVPWAWVKMKMCKRGERKRNMVLDAYFWIIQKVIPTLAFFQAWCSA